MLDRALTARRQSDAFLFFSFPVVVQEYEARVLDTHVLPGNTAVLNCRVPSFVRDFLTVTSWLQDHSFNIYPTAEGGEYRDTV